MTANGRRDLIWRLKVEVMLNNDENHVTSCKNDYVHIARVKEKLNLLGLRTPRVFPRHFISSHNKPYVLSEFYFTFHLQVFVLCT